MSILEQTGREDNYEPTAEDWADYGEWKRQCEEAVWEARLDALYESWLVEQGERDRERDECPRVGVWGGHPSERGE